MIDVSVLLIDDDEDDHLITKEILNKAKRLKYTMDCVKSYEEAIEYVTNKKYDVILIDYFLGAQNGIDVIKGISGKTENSAIIFLTGQKNSNVDTKALEFGAMDYIVKDQCNSDPKILERSILYSVEKKKIQKEVRDQKTFKQLIFDTIEDSIIVINTETNEITEINKSFAKMLKISYEFFKEFDLKSIQVSKYSEPKETRNIVECFGKCHKDCPCFNQPTEVLIQYNDIQTPCLLSCKKITFTNGKPQTYRLITLVDIAAQKAAEKQLKETNEELENLMKKYGIKKRKPSVLMDLLDVEFHKITKSLSRTCSKV